MINRILKLLSLLATLLTAACATKLPIVAVQLSDDDGNNRAPITVQEVQRWVDNANKIWDDSGYVFTFDPKKDFIRVNSTVLNSKPNDGSNPQWDMYRLTGNYLASLLSPYQIPVLFRQQGRTGWSGGPGHSNFISMPAYSNTCIKKSADGKTCPGGCCRDDSLLAHELGHYFGLVHTFSNVACGEANSDNSDGDRHGLLADNEADDIKDTDPDPGTNCVPSKVLVCDTGSVTIGNGRSFDPPRDNVMSYYRCNEQTLSDDQEDVVKWVQKNNPWRKRLGHE